MGEFILVIVGIAIIYGIGFWVVSNFQFFAIGLFSIIVLLFVIWIIFVIAEPAIYFAQSLSFNIKEWLVLRNTLKSLRNEEKNIEKEFKIRKKMEKNFITQKFSSIAIDSETKKELDRLYEEICFVLYRQKNSYLEGIDKFKEDVYEVSHSKLCGKQKIYLYQKISSFTEKFRKSNELI